MFRRALLCAVLVTAYCCSICQAGWLFGHRRWAGPYQGAYRSAPHAPAAQPQPAQPQSAHPTGPTVRRVLPYPYSSPSVGRGFTREDVEDPYLRARKTPFGPT